MAKRTPENPGEPRPEKIAKVKDLLGQATSPRLPQLTREQAMEVFRLQDAERRATRHLLAFVLCFLVVACLALCWLALAYEKPELIVDLAKIVAGLVVGFAGGYGARGAVQRTARRRLNR